MRGLTRGERGAATVEFDILLPLLVLNLGVVLAGGRLAYARTTVQQLADSGARAASLTRDAGTAQAAAAEVIASDAANARLTCAGGVRHTVDASGFAAALGTGAEVDVHVDCTVTLADLLVPGLPGEWAVEGSATSAIDRYRGRR